ncbi:MAG: M48 family metalloprotease, partial [Acidimicrobiales bacterium]
MAPLLLAGGLVLASLPAVLRRLGRRLGPAEWARLCLAALVSGAALVELGAALWAAPTLLRAMGVPALAMACDRLLGPLLPLGAAGGTLGSLVAVGVPILAWRGGRRTRAQTVALAIEPALGQHQHREGYDLVVLPTAHPLAYSLAGPAPQVVVSEGLCDSLTDAQVDAVIAHEVAHLTHR